MEREPSAQQYRLLDDEGSAFHNRVIAASHSGHLARSRRGMLVSVIANPFSRLWQGYPSLMRIELDQGLGLNLFPVFLAFGIAVYFAAPQEPSLYVLIGSAALSTGITLAIKHHGCLFILTAMLTAVFCGMLAAKLSVERVQAPQIDRQITAEISGVILSVDNNRSGNPRMVLRPLHLGKLGSE